MLISQMLRPHEIIRFNSPYFALAPIAGLQMKDEAVLIGDLILMRCNRAEWETVERGYVFKDWHSQYYEANPVFLYKPFAELSVEGIPAAFNELVRDATRLVTACRLYKTGRLLEPTYTVRFLSTDATRHRAVGPYRTEYLAMPIDGLKWSLEANEVKDVELLYSNLKTMELSNDTEALRVVIEQFNLSHTPTIPSFFSVHVLLTTIEMLFDRASKRLLLSKTRYDRALGILHWSMGNDEGSTFDEFYQHHVHSLRNAIHHNVLRDSNVDLAEAGFRLQVPIMLGIRLLMRLHRIEPSLSAFKRTHGWQDLTPKDLLIGCLDRYACGDSTPLNDLMMLQG
jgi:hypothetical protein